ncbi:glycosyltransferase [Litoribaculum gwangyangense]|uniref:Glycosyltransferase n=1 Tax=Litoribaculum gwangyangense TaxID=1130722 RepID=A0ABP9CTA6_9FLAO
MNKKICILTDSLSKGGAEKVAANLTISLTNKGYQVYVVSMTNVIDYQFTGNLYNFGLIKEAQNKFKAFLEFKNYFRKHKFDVIIDHRVRDKYLKEILFSKIIFRKQKVIYCIHSYNLSFYFSFLKLPRLAKFPHTKDHKFVAVCHEIKDYLNKTLNINSIHINNYLLNNTTPFENFNEDFFDEYIIGVGRLNKIKQFDKLITCYKNSNLPINKIKLLILGDGENKKVLKQLVEDLKLKDLVNFYPFRENPYGLIRNAKALVLTSKTEGFPMVLLEALSLNTPVISFDCKSGPGEIIKHGINGLLVDDQNEEALTLAINKLVDPHFYQKIKANADLDLEQFSESKAIEKWKDIFENPNKYFS